MASPFSPCTEVVHIHTLQTPLQTNPSLTVHIRSTTDLSQMLHGCRKSQPTVKKYLRYMADMIVMVLGAVLLMPTLLDSVLLERFLCKY
ncbi:hypothetical protein BDW72DRAFT_167310 [Aspergillus terricola var. indicus]